MNYLKKTGLQRVLFIMLLLMVGAGSTWADETRSYSITYGGVYSTGATYSLVSKRISDNAIITSGSGETTLTVEYTGSQQNFLTTANIRDFIEPNRLMNNSGGKNYYYVPYVTVSGNTITITYQYGFNQRYYVTVNPSDLSGAGGLQLAKSDASNMTVSYTATISTNTSNTDYTFTGTLRGPSTDASHNNEKYFYVQYVPYTQYNNSTANATNCSNQALTSSNISNYLKPIEIAGYTATISNVTTTPNSNTEYYSSARRITVTYTPNATTMYYKVQYGGANQPEGKGYTFNTNYSIDDHTTLASVGNDVYKATSNNSTYAPGQIMWSNVSSIVTPTAVDGYQTTLIVSGGSGTQADPYLITINYNQSWTVGDLVYSTFHIESTSHQYSLGDHEVAVALNFTESAPHYYLAEDVEDVVMYQNASDIPNGLTYTDDVIGQEQYLNGAKYVYNGQLDKTNGDGSAGLSYYYFTRTHDVARNTVTSVHIPNEVTLDGEVYKVVAIQKFGFVYSEDDQTLYEYCATEGGEPTTRHDNINDHCNNYLTTVTFETNSNIRSIGDYAFESANKLTSFIIPWTTEYLGVGAFQCAKALADVSFQENPNEGSEYKTTRVRTIREWTFFSCTGLETVYIADGVTKIVGQTTGSAFQYLPKLNYIRLPNTLTEVGPHFLCSATGLQYLTIPASVTYIDGAFLHGCESILEVSLLGDAAYLQGIDSNSNSFGYNHALCGSNVSGAKFYVPADYYDDYINDVVWSTLITPYGNEIIPVSGTERAFTAGKWTSVIFPKRVSSMNEYGDMDNNIALTADNVTSIFGEETIIDRLAEVTVDEEDKSWYHMRFEAVDWKNNGVPTGQPLMIKPQNQATFVFFDSNDIEDENFKLDMTLDHAYPITCQEDGAVIEMKGNYNASGYYLMKDEFLFKNGQENITGPDGEATEYAFYKMARNNAGHVAPCRCWWTITRGGVVSSVSGASGYSVRGILNGIDELEAEAVQNDDVRVSIEIYDLNGRRVYASPEQLPTGLFIVNGKKVLVK